MTEGMIRRHFDARAARYDNPLTALIGEFELRRIRPLVPPGSAVLDYGCGTGRATLDHLRRGCTVTAYDISGEMLAVARAKAQRWGLSVEFAESAEQLAGRTWPLVTCVGVLDYYPYPVTLLTALGSYLKPSGRLIVTFPNAYSPLAWLYALGSRLALPVTARTPRFARWAAERARLQVCRLDHAFPSMAPLGHTLIVSLSHFSAPR